MDSNAEQIKVFVIGPIGNKHAAQGSDARKSHEDAEQILREVIQPACEEHGLAFFRADEIHDMGEVDEQIFRLLRDSPIVIADLSGANPNVMYELGARHTVGKFTVPLMATSETSPPTLPFDITGNRTIIFPRTTSGVADARERLSKALAARLSGRGRPVTLTRVWLETPENRVAPAPPSPESAADVPAVSPPDQGRLSLLIKDSSLNVQSIEQVMDAGTAIIHQMTSVFDGVKNKAMRAKAAGERPDVTGILGQMAAELHDPINQLDVIAADVSQTIGRLRNNTEFLMTKLRATPGGPDAYPSFAEMTSSLRRLAGEGKSAAVKVSSFSEVAETYSSLPHAGIEFKRLKDVLRKLVASFRSLSELEDIL